MNSEGQPKFEGILDKLKSEMIQIVADGRNKTAQMMGYKDFDEAVKGKLKEAGFGLTDPIDSQAIADLLGQAAGLSTTVETISIFLCIRDS